MWVLHGLHFSFTKLLKIFFAFFLVWKSLLFGGPVNKMDWPGPGGLKVSYWTQWTSTITARTNEIVPRYWSEETATGSLHPVSPDSCPPTTSPSRVGYYWNFRHMLSLLPVFTYYAKVFFLFSFLGWVTDTVNYFTLKNKKITIKSIQNLI